MTDAWKASVRTVLKFEHSKDFVVLKYSNWEKWTEETLLKLSWVSWKHQNCKVWIKGVYNDV